MKYKKEKGFTVLELLITVAIIAVLSTVIVTMTNSARIKGRDSNRVSQIRQIRYALEQYRLTNGQYPQCLYVAAGCGTTLNGTTFMKNVPVDPKTAVPYAYAGLSTSVGGSTCTSYHLGTTLEDKTNQSLRSGSDAPASLNICAGSRADFEGLSYSSTASLQCSGSAGVPQPTSSATGESCYDVVPQ